MRPALLLIPVIMLLSIPVPQAGAAMYSYVDQYGRLHFTNVPADPRYKEVPEYDKIRRVAIKGRFGHHIQKAAERYSLDPELIRAVIKVESGYNPSAVSEKGAMGLMQLMPGTAEDMQVKEPFEAGDNIMGGSRYLRKMLDIFDGDLKLSLAAYNAGPNRVLPKRQVPGIPETVQYVKKVLREYGINMAGGFARQ
jgi:soluble lytic murein transglycosylase